MDIPKYKITIQNNKYFVTAYEIINKYPTHISLIVLSEKSDKIRRMIIITNATIIIEEIDGWEKSKNKDIESDKILGFDGLRGTI